LHGPQFSPAIFLEPFMPHIVVTGAAGFIGSHTVDQLLATGCAVTGVDNFRTGRRENLSQALAHPGFRLVEADIAAANVLDDVVGARPTDAVIHLAALVSVQESMNEPALNHLLNIQATHLAMEAARRHGVPRFVFASSAAVYGDTAVIPTPESTEKSPISPYGAAKLASEVLLLGYAAAFRTIVRCQRYFNVYGPRQDPASPYSGVISIFARRYREGKAVTIYGDGRQTRDFVSVHDVARANLIAATMAPSAGVANICTGRATSLLDVANVFAQHYPAVPAPTHAPGRAGDIIHSRGVTDEAARALGFRATVSIEEGLGELIRGAP
jgi:UDP-glucose 4-epimerase